VDGVKPNKALQEAMALIDPDGLLGRSDGDRRRIENMILGWMDSYGVDNALRMCDRSHRYLKAWKTVRDQGGRNRERTEE
jgi:hypothetical protein